jgi:hypothetical protein
MPLHPLRRALPGLGKHLGLSVLRRSLMDTGSIPFTMAAMSADVNTAAAPA